MIKGFFLGIFTAVFIVSLITIIFSVSIPQSQNLITGNVIGSGKVIAYSFVALFISFIISTIILIRILISR